MTSIERIFNKTFGHLDELETLLQYLKAERQDIIV